MDELNDFVEIRHYISIFLRRWWLVLLAVLIAAGIGYVVSQSQERLYRATTSVIVGQSIQATQLDSGDIQTSERLALTYADIARRQPVLEAVIVSLDLDYAWQNLRNRVRVVLVPDTQLLEISVDASSREEAISIADELARQLILISPTSLQKPEDESARLFVRERLQDLQRKIEANQAQLDELASAMAVAPTPEEKAQIQAEMNDLEGLLVDWENTYARFLEFVGREESANYIAVVDKAYARFNPVRPATRLNTMVAGLVGFMLALGVIFVLEYLDVTVKTIDDISQDLNLTPLGTIGFVGNGDFQGKMIVSENPRSPVAESYRMVRSNIQFMFIDNPGRAILVTSSVPGDGKSTTAVNLAIAMAHNGKRTVIVDADLRSPDLHKIFGVSNSDGLTEQLRQPESQKKIHLCDTKVEGLRLLTAGEQPPNPSELLGSQRMEQLVDSLTFEADVVIFDSPPAAYIADAAILSRLVDGVVLVVSAGKTRRDEARQAVFNLDQAGANILGVVLNGVAEKRGGYYYPYGSSTQELSQASKRIRTGLQQAWTTLTLAYGRLREKFEQLRKKEVTDQGQDTTQLSEEGKEVTNLP
jgi:non-specific protein-tyrosine kinase